MYPRKKIILSKDKKTLIGFSIIVIFTILALGHIICGKVGENVDGNLSGYALEDIKDTRFEKLKSFKKLIKLYPNNFFSYYELGKLYNQLQQFEKAEEYLSKADRLSKNNLSSKDPPLGSKVKYDILIELANALSKQNKFSEAIAILERAKKMDPQKTNAYNKRGNIHDKKKEYTKAKREYIKAKKINKRDPESYKNIANQFFKKNKNLDALSELKEAIHNNPSSYKTFEHLGDGYQKIKNFDKALDFYRRAVKLKLPLKDKSRIYYKIAKTYLAKGDQINYKKNLKKADSQGEEVNPSVSEALGDIAKQNGKNKKALDFYKRALSRSSNNKELRKKYKDTFSDVKRQVEKRNQITQKKSQNRLKREKNDDGNFLVEDDILDANNNLENSNSLLKDTKKINNKMNHKKRGEDISKLIIEGKKAFKNKEYVIAGIKFREAQKKNPKYPKVDYLLARSQDKLKRYKKAIKNYTKAVKKESKDKKSFYHLGLLYYRQAKYLKALHSFKNAIKIDSMFTNAHYSAGLCYDKLSKNIKAMQKYKKSIKLKPKLYQGHFNLGITYKKLNKYYLALSSFNKAEIINPSDPHLFYQRGELFFKQKKLLSAKIEYKKVIKLNSKHHEARFNLAIIQSQLGQKNEARKILKQLQSEQPNDSAISYQLGIIAEREKNYQLAIAEYKSTLEKNKGYYKAYLNLGGVYSTIKRYNEAKNAYKKAKKLKPSAFEPPLNIGNIYFQTKNYAEAKKYYEKALLIRSNHIPTRLAFAKTLEYLKFYQLAKQQYLLILKKKSNHLSAMESLAFLYHRKLKNKTSARKIFRKIINHHPSHPKKKEYEQIIQLLVQ